MSTVYTVITTRSRLPHGLQATEVTLWPLAQLITRATEPVATSHNFTVSSNEQVARRWPSGLHIAVLTLSMQHCAHRVFLTVPVAASHTLIPRRQHAAIGAPHNSVNKSQCGLAAHAQHCLSLHPKTLHSHHMLLRSACHQGPHHRLHPLSVAFPQHMHHSTCGHYGLNL